MRAAEALDAAEAAGSRQEYALAARWLGQAQCLVEIIEESDCGRVGGYDTRRGQTDPGVIPAHLRLRSRIVWLTRIGAVQPTKES